MKLNNDDFIELLRQLNVNLKEESVLAKLIEGYRFLGENIGTDERLAKINLYCLLGKFVNLNDDNMIDAIKKAIHILEENKLTETYMIQNLPNQDSLNHTQKYIQQWMLTSSVDFDILIHNIIRDFELPISNYSTYCFKEVLLYGFTHNFKNMTELYSIVGEKINAVPDNIERGIRYVNEKYIQKNCSKEIYKMFFAIKGPISDSTCILSIIKYIKNLEKVISKNNSILSDKEQKDLALEQFIIKVLYELGFSSHLVGYDYLKEAILYIINQGQLVSVTKELYPAIAKKFHANSKNIEHNIHTLILSTSTIQPTVENDGRNFIFGPNTKLSNGKIIYAIVDYIMNFQLNSSNDRLYSKTFSSNIESISSHEKTIENSMISKQQRQFISEVLSDLKISNQSNSFLYFLEAILYLLNQENPISFSNELYPYLAKKMNQSPRNIEISMYHKIRDNLEVLKKDNSIYAYEMIKFYIQKGEDFSTRDYIYKIIEFIHQKQSCMEHIRGYSKVKVPSQLI